LKEIENRDIMMQEIGKVLEATNSEIKKVQKQKEIISNLEVELHRIKEEEFNKKLEEMITSEDVVPPADLPEGMDSSMFLEHILANVENLKKQVKSPKQNKSTPHSDVDLSALSFIDKMNQHAAEPPQMTDEQKRARMAELLGGLLKAPKVKTVKSEENSQSAAPENFNKNDHPITPIENIIQDNTASAEKRIESSATDDEIIVLKNKNKDSSNAIDFKQKGKLLKLESSETNKKEKKIELKSETIDNQNETMIQETEKSDVLDVPKTIVENKALHGLEPTIEHIVKTSDDTLKTTKALKEEPTQISNIKESKNLKPVNHNQEQGSKKNQQGNKHQNSADLKDEKIADSKNKDNKNHVLTEGNLSVKLDGPLNKPSLAEILKLQSVDNDAKEKSEIIQPETIRPEAKSEIAEVKNEKIEHIKRESCEEKNKSEVGSKNVEGSDFVSPVEQEEAKSLKTLEKKNQTSKSAKKPFPEKYKIAANKPENQAKQINVTAKRITQQVITEKKKGINVSPSPVKLTNPVKKPELPPKPEFLKNVSNVKSQSPVSSPRKLSSENVTKPKSPSPSLSRTTTKATPIQTKKPTIPTKPTTISGQKPKVNTAIATKTNIAESTGSPNTSKPSTKHTNKESCISAPVILFTKCHFLTNTQCTV
jgi:hypothetical protein